MKKFLTFFALALITVTGVWAQQITDLADITAGKQVYIKRNDGAYYINIANSSATTATLQSTPSLITLVDAGDGSFYFYNEDTRLYVGITGTDATTAPSASSTADAGKFTFMTSYGTNTAPNGVFYIHVDNGQRGGGNTDFLNKNNGQPNSIMTWSLSGNSYCQWVVTEVEPYEVVISGAPSATTVTILGKTYTNGASIPYGTDFTDADVQPTEISGYKAVVTITSNKVVVNYVAEMSITGKYVHSLGSKTTEISPSQWYVLTNARDKETPTKDNGIGEVVNREEKITAAEIFTLNAPAEDVAKYLVRLIPTGVGNSYKIQFGTGNYFNTKDRAAVAKNVQIVSDATEAISLLAVNAANGLAFGPTTDGTTNAGFYLDNSNAKADAMHLLSFWTPYEFTNNGNNVWFIAPVELGEYLNTTTVTYNYYYNGTLKGTKTSNQEIGATVAAPASIHIFTANEYDESAVVSADLVVDVTVKDATPFVAAESYDKIEHWYATTIHSNQTHYLYNNNGAIAFNNSTFESAPEYAWGFVGNPFDGYTVYNKAAGDAVALDSETPCGLTAAGTSVQWIIGKSKETSAKGLAGFCLNVSGQQYINYQSAQLKRWGSNDAGSTFNVEEVYLGEHEYTVNITGGAPEGTKVTINGNEYGNGETVTLDATTATISTPSVDLYNAVVAYNGLNININYVACGIKTMTEIVQGQAYTITSGGTRGAFVINNEKLTSTSKAGVTASDADAYQQFLFVQYDSKYYLYSVGADKFISLAEDGNSTVLTDEPVETDIQFLASEHSCKGTNPVVLQMDEHHLGVSNGYDPAVITTWKSTNDEGNSLRIWPVEATIDMDAILAKFKTGLEVVIGDTGYATFYDEDNRIIPTGVKAYYCTKGEEGVLGTVQITNLNYIPRWTGVILEGTPGTYYLEEIPTIMADDEEIDKIVDDNVLNGTLEDMSVEDLRAELGDYVVYVLAKKNDRLGFYQFVGNTLAGRKAFYVNANALVNGFILDFEGTEGINSVISATNLKAGYDIQGRKLNKMQKGINILNGKKIIK